MELTPFLLFSIILFSALAALVALKILRLPTIPAYFIAGLFAGPHGLHVLSEGQTTETIAEMGIILLMFTIGLKFNLNALSIMRRFVFLLGGLQVTLTFLIFFIPASIFFDSLLLGSLMGSIAAMSSTAIVSQILIEENKVVTPTGRRSMGILILQDLLVIPLIIIYSDGYSESSIFITISLLVIKITLIMFFVILFGRKLMRFWLNWIVKYGDKELFVFNLIAVIVGFSLATSIFGLSPVLGSFIAGILIAETFHRYRTEQIIEPFRQILLGFFFMTLGTLINPTLLKENFYIITLLTVVFLVIKVPIVYFCCKLVHTHSMTSTQTAVLLGGAGEFGFVLLSVANKSDILTDELFQLLVPVNILALIAVPLFWLKIEKIISFILRNDWLRSAKKITQNINKSANLEDHSIICGFGRTGQSIVGIFRSLKVKFIVIEDDHTILETIGKTENVIYGNSIRPDSLITAGILRAKSLIISYYHETISPLTIESARRLNKDIYIIAKAMTVQQSQILTEAGADEVLIEPHECGFSIAGQHLRRTNKYKSAIVNQHMLDARQRRNPLFLGEYGGTLSENPESSFHLMGFCVSNQADDQPIENFLAPDVQIVAWRRNNQELNIDNLQKKVKKNDEVVLRGKLKDLETTKENLTLEDTLSS